MESSLLVLGICAALMVVAVWLVRPTRARGFHWLLLVAATLAGGVLGGFDFGLIGAGAGAVAGLVAGSLVAGVLYFVVGLFTFHDPTAWCGRLLVIVFLGVMCHDLYWWNHVCFLTSTARASADVHTAAEGDGGPLRKNRVAHHGSLSALTSRPLRWLLSGEAMEQGRAALALVEPLLDMSGEVPERERAALRAQSIRIRDEAESGHKRHAEKTWVLNWVRTLIDRLVSAGGESEDQAPTKKRETPRGKSLADVVREAIGDAPATHEDRWDDGSGGEPEMVVVVSGPNLHRLQRDGTTGWRRAGSMDISSLHLASGRRFDGHFVAISLHGKGCMVGHKSPGTPSFSVVTLEGDEPKLAGQLGDSGAATTREMSGKLAAWVKREYPELDPDWVDQVTMRTAEEFCKAGGQSQEELERAKEWRQGSGR